MAYNHDYVEDKSVFIRALYGIFGNMDVYDLKSLPSYPRKQVKQSIETSSEIAQVTKLSAVSNPPSLTSKQQDYARHTAKMTSEISQAIRLPVITDKEGMDIMPASRNIPNTEVENMTRTEKQRDPSLSPSSSPSQSGHYAANLPGSSDTSLLVSSWSTLKPGAPGTQSCQREQWERYRRHSC